MSSKCVGGLSLVYIVVVVVFYLFLISFYGDFIFWDYMTGGFLSLPDLDG